jgi:hypothetical protein
MKNPGGLSMAHIRLTKRGQALAAKRKAKRKVAALQKEVFKMYTLKNTGEKVLVNENEIFRQK